MDNSIWGITGLKSVAASNSLNNVKKMQTLPGFENSVFNTDIQKPDNSGSFDSILKSAMGMINETNRYSNEAAEAELSYAMGVTNSTHDLQVAQMKANISLQYTVAIRNAVMDAYKEIMQMQF